MSLLGWPLLVLTVGLALVAPAVCVLLWARARGVAALPVRLALILICQVTAVAAVADVVNRQGQYYASWSDLGGDGAAGDTPIQEQNTGVQALPRPLAKRLRNDFHPSDGALVAEPTGLRSGVRAKIWVWLPPQYRQHPRSRFPVVELFSGYPGTAVTWMHSMQGPKKLMEAMRSGAAQPYILVAPTITVRPGHDTECADVPHGPKVATWLTDDVRRIVTENFRALPGRDAWGTMGYSTGGFCAAKLTAQHPRMFRAAVSLSGYFTPVTPPLARDPRENVLDIVQRDRPAVDLLLAASKQDHGTVAAVNSVTRVAKAPTLVYTYVVPRGGHNTGVWTAMLPKSFLWLTTKLTHEQ